jgi:GT2 family glycosyltransferase
VSERSPAQRVADSRAPQRGLTSVVVVAADSGESLIDCVARLAAATAPLEVIVVDNDSRDGSIERLARRFADDTHLQIVRVGRNLGFGAGCDRGAALAAGDACLFLNPDCLLEPDTIARVRGLLAADATIGLVGALQVDGAGRIDPASRRHDPVLRRALLTASGLSRLNPALGGVELASPPQGDAENVDAVSGALMLVRRDVFANVGGFDEGYFLHCEDLDLCRRIRDAGYRVVCANDVRVVHAKGGSSRARPVFVAWHKHRGMWRWFTKFDPAARNVLLRAIVWCGIWTAFALRLPLLAARRVIRARAPH